MASDQQIGIIGSGPAGLSAALWLKNLGLQPWLIDSAERPGGLQNHNVLGNDWVLGQRNKTGRDIAAEFVAHLEEAAIPITCHCTPLALHGTAGHFRIQLSQTAATGAHLHERTCAALLIATGTRPRAAEVLVGVPGVARLPVGRILYGPPAFADIDQAAGQRILIVGGGDNAFENARLLLAAGARVSMALRSPPRAQTAQTAPVLAAQAQARSHAQAHDGRCTLYQPARITALAWQADAVQVQLDSVAETLTVDRLHILTGYEPNTAFLSTFLSGLQTTATSFSLAEMLDSAGYLQVDAAGRTRMAGLYAAGDVCHPEFPSVVSALAQGARAAKTIATDLSLP
ncbi:MAG: NAD(P)/FAD-dependent oxidoreductase [Sterolibacterium sp.]|nr:NAD(P)/FAD-dependent oxidoreductase [Sterolibacterium sp.]MBP9800401.1 NAD(P)/FAD-dependent oxidoreductase [Sterolibacterium sp.]